MDNDGLSRRRRGDGRSKADGSRQNKRMRPSFAWRYSGLEAAENLHPIGCTFKA